MDNDTKEMFQLLINTQDKISKRLDEMGGRLDSIEQLATKTALTQAEMNDRLDSIEQLATKTALTQVEMNDRLDEMGGRLDEMSNKQDEMGGRLDSIEQLAKKTAVVQENDVADKIQLIYENQISIIDSNKKIANQDNRIENLENDVFALKYAFKALKQG